MWLRRLSGDLRAWLEGGRVAGAERTARSPSLLGIISGATWEQALRQLIEDSKKAAAVPAARETGCSPQPVCPAYRKALPLRARLTPEAAPTFPWHAQAVAEAQISH